MNPNESIHTVEDLLHSNMSILLDSYNLVVEDCKLSIQQKEKSHDRESHSRDFLQKNSEIIQQIQNFRPKKEDYKIIRKLADGAHGEVYMVSLNNSKIYAMKKIPKSNVYTNPEAKFYMDERDVLVLSRSNSLLNTKWLTKIQCSFQDSTHLYLIMDYIPGGDLMSLLLGYPDERFSESMAKFYLVEIIEALEELHTLGYVHRDLKPDNILIDKSGHIKLADFGACYKLNEYGQVDSNVPVGTPEYISPEVLKSRETKEQQMHYGTECDWWSLGILFYEMLFGLPAFQHDSLSALFSSIMNHKEHFKIPNEPEISQDAKDLLYNLICDREIRLGKAQDVKNHPYFSDIIWKDLYQSQPPFVPSSEFLEKLADPTQLIHQEYESHNVSRDRLFYGYHIPFIGYSYSPDLFTEKKPKEEELNTKLIHDNNRLMETIRNLEKYSSELLISKNSLECRILEESKAPISPVSINDEFNSSNDRDVRYYENQIQALVQQLEMIEQDHFKMKSNSEEKISSLLNQVSNLELKVLKLNEKSEMDQIKINSLIIKLQETVVNVPQEKKALILCKQEIRQLKSRLDDEIQHRKDLEEQLLSIKKQNIHLAAIPHSRDIVLKSLSNNVTFQSQGDTLINQNICSIDASQYLAAEGWLKIPTFGTNSIFQSKWKKIYAWITLYGRMYISNEKQDFSNMNQNCQASLLDLADFISIKPATATELPRLPSKEISNVFKIIIINNRSRLIEHQNIECNENEESLDCDSISNSITSEISQNKTSDEQYLRIAIEKEEKVIEGISKMKIAYESNLGMNKNKKKSIELEQQIVDTERQLKYYKSNLIQLKERLNTLKSYPETTIVNIPVDNNEDSESSSITSKSTISSRQYFPTIQGHQFIENTFPLSTICMHCRQLLYGKKLQGYKCSECQFICHKSCFARIELTCQEMIQETHTKSHYFCAQNEYECKRWTEIIVKLVNKLRRVGCDETK